MTTETKTDPKPSVIPYKREAIDIYALIDFIPGEPEAQPDAMLQEPILTESVITPLADWLTDGGIDRTVFVSSDTILCYDRSDLNIRIQPDCYVAFGVDVQAIRERELYLPWEVGKVPDFALEVASRTTARRDPDGEAGHLQANGSPRAVARGRHRGRDARRASDRLALGEWRVRADSP